MTPLSADNIVLCGDARMVLPTLYPSIFDAVIVDGPYGLGLTPWDVGNDVWDPVFWSVVARTLKAGRYLAAFSAPKYSHRLATAIEAAGLSIEDNIPWLFGNGVPKGGRLKDGHDSIVLAAMPGQKRPLNIDDCRIPYETIEGASLAVNTHLRKSIKRGARHGGGLFPAAKEKIVSPHPNGRYPSNVLHDGGAETLSSFSGPEHRFFYAARLRGTERAEVSGGHLTPKPVSLMRWLVRLLTDPGERILDCFAGSGTTGVAAMIERRTVTLIEREDEFVASIRARLERGALESSM